MDDFRPGVGLGSRLGYLRQITSGQFTAVCVSIERLSDPSLCEDRSNALGVQSTADDVTSAEYQLDL